MALLRADLNIYIYTGTQGSFTDDDLRYTISKEKLSSDSNIVIEIGELVKDYIDVTFNNDYTSTTKWVSITTTLIDSDTNEAFASGGTFTNHYLAFEGFGYFEDEINPQLSTNALITTSNIYVPDDTACKIPILAEGVGKYVIGSTTTQVTDSGNSNQKIQYLTVPANTTDNVVIYATDDSTVVKTMVVNNVCEPKFTPYKITFINKYGAYQDLYVFKKTTEKFNVKDETYKVNTVNESNITYNTYDGQRQRYNTNAQTTLTVNTGYVSEDFTTAIEELFLTENAWIRIDSKTLPIIPKSKSMSMKTVLNDKLIDYTIDFDFAFNKINNVR